MTTAATNDTGAVTNCGPSTTLRVVLHIKNIGCPARYDYRYNSYRFYVCNILHLVLCVYYCCCITLGADVSRRRHAVYNIVTDAKCVVREVSPDKYNTIIIPGRKPRVGAPGYRFLPTFSGRLSHSVRK